MGVFFRVGKQKGGAQPLTETANHRSGPFEGNIRGKVFEKLDESLGYSPSRCGTVSEYVREATSRCRARC